jgi:hypothetical protein
MSFFLLRYEVDKRAGSGLFFIFMTFSQFNFKKVGLGNIEDLELLILEFLLFV